MIIQLLLMHAGRQLCIGLMLFLISAQTGLATETRTETVWLLSSRTGGDYQEVVDAFMQRLATVPQLKVRALIAATEADMPTVKFAAAAADLIVAIGSDAARLAETLPRTHPVLDILIPRLLYEQLTTAGSTRSALYIDQPFERQLHLCRLLVPNLRELAVLYGPSSQSSDSELRRVAQRFGITLKTQHVTAGNNPNAALDRILDGSQLLLALPDPDVFTRYTVAGLLLTTYHHGVPVLGFSAAYVRAGALAAVYSTPEQIGRAAAEMALSAHTSAGWILPAPRYPAYFKVAVNRQVGRSLNLKLPKSRRLQRSLLGMEQEPP